MKCVRTFVEKHGTKHYCNKNENHSQATHRCSCGQEWEVIKGKVYY